MPQVETPNTGDPVTPTVVTLRPKWTLSAAGRAFVRLALRLIASGALTVGVTALTGHLSPVYSGLVLSGWASLLTYAQVHVEDKTGKAIGITPPVSTATPTNTSFGSI